MCLKPVEIEKRRYVYLERIKMIRKYLDISLKLGALFARFDPT